MGQRFGNDWLRGVISKGRESRPSARPTNAGYEPLLRALYSLQPHDALKLFKPIQEFEGTKLMVACSDRTPLESVVKQALCMADLVILVPAPLWVSCNYPGSTGYAEFNFESVTLAGCFSVSMQLLKEVARLMVAQFEAFDDGSVTFLPVLGDTLHRWSHVELSLPEFPRPYSENRGAYPPSDVHLEAFYGLLGERLAAERLGAVHMNAASFETAVLGDFVLGKQDHSGDWKRSLVEVCLPDFTDLPMSSIRRIRDEVPTMIRALAPENVRVIPAEPIIEDLRAASRDWTRQVEGILAKTGIGGAQRSVFLGSGGRNGSAMTAADFLLGGGSLDDLVRMITYAGKERLKIRRDSMLAAIQ